MTDEELKALVASISVDVKELTASQKELTESQKKTDAQLAKTDAQLEKTDAQLNKTIKKLDNIGVILGHYGIVQGEMTEEMVFRGLQNLFGRIGKNFEEIAQNLKRKGQAEFDIVAVNGTEVLVAEVKTKVRQDDIEKFVKERLPNFKKYFPQYKNYKILGAVGGNIFRDDLSNYAQKQGLYVIQQTGDNLELANSKDFEAKVFG